MKKIKNGLLWLLCLAMMPAQQIMAQEESNDYVMYESIILSPNKAKLKVLGENMQKHNQKYHNTAPFSANVYNISTGAETGKLVWMMGPMKFSDLDSRPAEGGHDEDWRDNIMPYLDDMGAAEYWKADGKLSNLSMMDGTPGQYPIIYVRYWNVERGQGHNVDQFLETVSSTIKNMPGENPWGVYDNQFRQGEAGRHLATVSYHKKWAELDEPNTFRKSYDEVHGENTWDAFIKNNQATFSNSWDEIWVYNKKMSGD
ncbi:hypothetical protein PP178_09305 [Zeaxanthinibacter sp. PT1]|uniref:hypothetical protein n=1 Tax=Zeaxanthinibacter TaxID=561554 RepID=UPI00234A1784|nr:hypothetical protein [Zeaxanthinibacter sp. PT1]MDC6351752.1 hypothetical protein [Zeaxanthinibacter sp. PT1]